jgi:hypothetical protein
MFATSGEANVAQAKTEMNELRTQLDVVASKAEFYESQV